MRSVGTDHSEVRRRVQLLQHNHHQVSGQHCLCFPSVRRSLIWLCSPERGPKGDSTMTRGTTPDVASTHSEAHRVTAPVWYSKPSSSQRPVPNPVPISAPSLSAKDISTQNRPSVQMPQFPSPTPPPRSLGIAGSHRLVPPDGFIPTLDEGAVISLPPPHELNRPGPPHVRYELPSPPRARRAKEPGRQGTIDTESVTLSHFVGSSHTGHDLVSSPRSYHTDVERGRHGTVDTRNVVDRAQDGTAVRFEAFYIETHPN